MSEHLNRNVECVQADILYTVQADRNYNHTEYDALASNDTKVMSKVLGAIVQPEAHQYALCSALQFFLRYRPLTL